MEAETELIPISDLIVLICFKGIGLVLLFLFLIK